KRAQDSLFPGLSARGTIRTSLILARCAMRVVRLCLFAIVVSVTPVSSNGATPIVKVGAAAVELEADDDMVIGGGILPYKVKGEEGKLRAVAVVIEQPAGTGKGKVAIVACDVLMMARDQLDPAVEEIAKALEIPTSHVLVNCTHTHHAPSTVTVHGYPRDEL